MASTRNASRAIASRHGAGNDLGHEQTRSGVLRTGCGRGDGMQSKEEGRGQGTAGACHASPGLECDARNTQAGSGRVGNGRGAATSNGLECNGIGGDRISGDGIGRHGNRLGSGAAGARDHASAGRGEDRRKLRRWRRVLRGDLRQVHRHRGGTRPRVQVMRDPVRCRHSVSGWAKMRHDRRRAWSGLSLTRGESRNAHVVTGRHAIRSRARGDTSSCRCARRTSCL
jgi:hypothetical protein